MSVPALPRTAARTWSLSCSVYWFPSEKCVANLRASESSDANASVLKDWNSSTWTKNGARFSGA